MYDSRVPRHWQKVRKIILKVFTLRIFGDILLETKGYSLIVYPCMSLGVLGFLHSWFLVHRTTRTQSTVSKLDYGWQTKRFLDDWILQPSRIPDSDATGKCVALCEQSHVVCVILLPCNCKPSNILFICLAIK